MSRLKILLASLICGLIISLAFNVILSWELMENLELNRDLSQAYNQLCQSYDELNESYLPPKPPISKSEAIDIALEYGGWNETSLEGMEVEATLDYMMFCNGGMTHLHQVTGDVTSYKPMRIGDASFRYLWVVVVSEKGFVVSIPPPGLYYVDPVTGEVTSYNDIILGKTP